MKAVGHTACSKEIHVAPRRLIGHASEWYLDVIEKVFVQGALENRDC